MGDYTLRLEEVDEVQANEVGSKAASLAKLAKLGFNSPNGFVIRSTAYIDVLEDIEKEFGQRVRPSTVRSLLKSYELVESLRDEIAVAYNELLSSARLGVGSVAVRSSASLEDLPNTSAAGIYGSVLNVKGFDGLVNGVKKCWASAWSNRATAYRERLELDYLAVKMAVLIQEFVPAEVAGVMFSMNPVSGDRNEAIVNSCWGLGLRVVSGTVTPDSFTVSKTDYAIKRRRIAEKRVTYLPSGEGSVKRLRASADLRSKSSLNDDSLR